jgi:hypothetical protein
MESTEGGAANAVRQRRKFGVVVLFTAEERRALLLRARAAGVTMAGYIRAAVGVAP